MHPPLTLIVRRIQHHQSVAASRRFLSSLGNGSNNGGIFRYCTTGKYNVALIARTKIMKHPSSIVVPAAMFALAPSSTYGWISQSRTLTTTQRWKNAQFLSSTQWYDTSSSRMFSTLDTALDVATSDEESIKIAEGAILSQYPGGFTAIRINDANGFLEPSNDPVVVGVGTSESAPAREVNKMSSTSSMNSISNGIKLTSIDYQGKAVTYPNGDTGVVIAHRPPLVFCYSDSESISSSSKDETVTVMNEMVKISLSPRDLHVDGFGNPIETSNSIQQGAGGGEEQSILKRVIFGPIPKVSEIALINHPMITGNTMIDTLAPIGRGQNMLLIGSQLDDMRAVARDFLKTQIITSKQSSSPPTVCVYASTEQDQNVAYQRIKNAGIADDIHYVGTKPSSHAKDETSFAAEAVLVVNTAIAIAESYALKEKRHTVVVVDTIDLHKTLHDATTRILVDTFGIQSVVQQDPNGGGTSSSEMRSFYSSFIQRAGQYNTKMGGGSVTLLLLTTIPTTATTNPDENDNDQIFTLQDFEHCGENIKSRLNIIAAKGIALTAATLRKINIPLPTVSEYDRRMQLQHIDELISMSDGQIWFDDAIPTRPPMDPQKSITRIGVGADTPSRADAPAIRRIAEGIRLELVQSAMSSMTGTELSSSATQHQIRRQQALLLAMYQPPGAPIRRLSDSCTVLLAARRGYLDHCIDQNMLAGSEDGTAIIEQLLFYVNTNAKDIVDEIDETLDITDSSKTKLTDSIAEFFKKSTLK